LARHGGRGHAAHHRRARRSHGIDDLFFWHSLRRHVRRFDHASILLNSWVR
jgi:hypothetical protein